MIDIKNIRVGDRGTLKPFEIVAIVSADCVRVEIDDDKHAGGERAYRIIHPSAIASIEPRPLKVGKARLKYQPYGIDELECEVLHIHGDYAWTMRPGGQQGAILPVKQLENIEDAP